jgi:hypothetical protein
MLARYIGNSDYFKSYKNFIFKIVSFIKHEKEVSAIILPVKTSDWSEIKDNVRLSYSASVYKNRLIVIDINDIEIILDSEIPQDVKRDLKISNILDTTF